MSDIEKNFDKAVEVISSFEKAEDDDIVFVQPMLEDVKLSEVCFTRDPSNSSNYYNKL